jgi:MFS family permease
MEKKPALLTKDLAVTTVMNVFVCCGSQVMLPTLPLFMKSIGAGPGTIGAATAVFTCAALLTRPLAGLALDRVGRRGVFTAGAVLLSLALFSYSFFPVVAAMFLIRFVNGVAWGASSTSTNTIAVDAIPKPRMSEGMSLLTMTTYFAQAVCPVVGLALFYGSGFRSVTIGASGMVLAALLLSLLVRLRKAPNTGAKAKFIPYEKHALLPSLVMLCAATSFGPILTFLSLYGENLDINISWYFAVSVVSLLATRMLSKRIIDRHGFRVMVMPGFVLFAVSLVVLSLAESLPAVLLSGFILGMGHGTVQVSMQTMALMSAPPERTGAANATFLMSLDGGVMLGNLIGGSVAAAVGYSTMYLLAIVPLTMGAVLYMFISKKRKPAPREAAS